MATTAQVDALVALYAGYFNRAPDPAGLQFWIDQIDNGRDFNTIAADFAASPEATALYPYLTSPDVASPTGFITSIYQNLFNRDPDAAGLEFWSGVLESGSVSVADMIEAIINGAVNAPDATPPTFDKTTLENKIEVGRDFAESAANTPGFEFDAAAKSASIDVLDGVTHEEETVVEAKAETDAFLEGAANPGDTFTLTTGADVVAGTAGNDTINALSVNATGGDATTLSAFDEIDGGAGTDTLNIYTDTDNEGNDSFPASASVENVEIVNIHNANGVAATLADASNYEGVEQLWQINAAAGVTNLQASTAAGFRDIKGSSLSVAAAAAATSATVVLDNVDDDETILFVSGEALNSVTVVGAVVDSDDEGDTVDPIGLAVEPGADETSVTVNTAVDVDLMVDSKSVTSVDAAASTGAIRYYAHWAVENVMTGSGDDTVGLFTWAPEDGTAASLSTGDGDDTLFIEVDDGESQDDVSVSVDAGAGDDSITVDNSGSVALNLAAGDGDDKVSLSDGLGSVATTDVIDGGAGTDTVVVAGKALVAEDYILLNDVITNFEGVEFTSSPAVVDASRMATYTDFTFAGAGGDKITKVGAGITLTTGGNLEAIAAGYNAGANPDIEGDETYAGTLDITATGHGTVDAFAETVNLTVDTSLTSDTYVETWLTGDVQSATVTLSPSTNDNGTESTADDFFNTPAVVVVANSELAAMESITVTGNGEAWVVNADNAALANIDASGLNSVDIDGDANGGLMYETYNDSLAETISLGDGIDDLLFGNGGANTGSTYENIDTVVGLNLIDDGGALGAGSDKIHLNSLSGFEATTVSASTLDLALVDLAAEDEDYLVFDFGGDTYIYADIDENDVVDDTDVVIKLAGGVDNDLLADALNMAP